MSGLLEGKSILVTGAASGIGLATVRLAVREGASVTLVDRDPAKLQAVLRGLHEEAPGGRMYLACADVRDDAQVQAAVASAVQAFGELHGAFNNAGVSTDPSRPSGEKAADIDPGAWQRVMDTNVTGVWYCMRAEIRHMLEAGTQGAIVNTASVGGLVGLRGHAAYAASKHAVVGLTRSAAADYARSGLRINAICPGVIATPMNAVLLDTVADKAVQGIPVRRFGQPEEIAEVVVWLLSDRASFVTGAALTADGGYTAI